MKSQYKNIFLAGFLHYTLETRWLGGNFLMVYRNNAGRLGSGFISVCFRKSLAGSKKRFLCPRSVLYSLLQPILLAVTISKS